MKCLRWQRMSLTSLAIAMTILAVVVAEDDFRAVKSDEDEPRLLVAPSALDNQQQIRSQQNLPVSRRMVFDETRTNPGESRKKEESNNRKKNRNRKNMAKRKKNTPVRRLPAKIKKVGPLLAKPSKVSYVRAKRTKNPKCGKSYNVKNGQKFRIRLTKQSSCKIIFRATKGTSLKIKCSKIIINDCEDGQLYISDGASLESRYCGEETKTKLKSQTVNELFVSYNPASSVEAKKGSRPNVLCIVNGRKGTGYAAAGTQKCPLSCGQTIASAEAETKQLSKATDNTVSPSPSPVVTANVISSLSQALDLINSSLTSISSVMSSYSSSTTENETLVNEKRSETVRVQGGKAADIGEWPWMVLLKIIFGKNILPCGGTIITPFYILTVAHCVHDVKFNKGNKIKAIANEYNIMTSDETVKQTRNVKKIILHPNYDSRIQDSDIALLKVNKKFVFGPGVGSICLAPDGVYDGSEVVTLGWGSVSYGGDDPAVLQEALQRVDNVEECSKNYSSLLPQTEEFPITSKHVCTSAPGVDSCTGDSGGPIQIRIGTVWYQLGIVSFGHKCAEPGFPGVSTRVPDFTGWILEIIRKDTCT